MEFIFVLTVFGFVSLAIILSLLIVAGVASAAGVSFPLNAASPKFSIKSFRYSKTIFNFTICRTISKGSGHD